MEYKYFWKSYSPFSNWYMSDFKIYSDKKFSNEKEETTFCCMEQYMMFRKALLFNDIDIARKIMSQNDPSKIKALGKLVKNFNNKLWDKEKYNIVKTGILAKFSQNEKLKSALLKYHGQTFVEASPYDRIWGIGFIEEDAPFHMDEWGENLLGKILTEVCNELKQ